MIFLATLGMSVSVLLNFQDNDDEIKAAVACMVLAVSFLSIGLISFRIFIVFFVKKIVTALSVKQIEKSLEFSAFKNMHDI
jgi:hypothetical protein